jgi:cysteinyl-tRNA synthetase, unknown class
LIRFARLLVVPTAVVLALFAMAQLPAPPRAALPARSNSSLSGVKAWGYQLQRARPDLIHSEIDLLVIDHARDSSSNALFTAADIDAFRRRSGAPDRIVLAYLSIGEAETYRSYWRKHWIWPSLGTILKPGWLGSENQEWKGNYLVRYWQPGWQRLIVEPTRSRLDALRQDWFGADAAYIDQILEAGFDGVYLDRVDAFSQWEKSNQIAQDEMIAFVSRISAYAKARKPGFLVVPQNGEELTARPSYVQAIDGLAKEDLMYGIDGNDRENAPDEIAHSTGMLARVRRAALPVFVVEYLTDAEKQRTVLRRLAPQGFLPTFATRQLNTPPMLPPMLTTPSP